jgi:sugar phosphate isomerase/epimerase
MISKLAHLPPFGTRFVSHRPHDNGGVDDNHLPPGEGRIDCEKFLRDLIEVRFRGAFILEMAGNDDPAVTMTNARRGRQYLREVSRRIALSSD